MVVHRGGHDDRRAHLRQARQGPSHRRVPRHRPRGEHRDAREVHGDPSLTARLGAVVEPVSATGAGRSGAVPRRTVARTEPPRINANDSMIVPVNGSPRKTTPAATATAGFTYVNTIPLDVPTSRMSSKNTMNANAVHTRPSPASAARTRPLGSVSGRVTAAGPA